MISNQKLNYVITEKFLNDEISLEKYIKLTEYLNEGTFLKSRISFYVEEIPNLIKGVNILQKEAQSYLKKVKWKFPDYLEDVVLEIQIIGDPTIKSLRSGNNKTTLILSDANAILDKKTFVIKKIEVSTKV